MKRLYLAGLFLLLSVSVAFSQYSGVVYVDVNDNGVFDRKDEPVKNARLSNGFHVVKTDKKGRYELPDWEKFRFITLYPSPEQYASQRFIAAEKPGDEYNFAVEIIEAPSEQVTFLQVSDTETNEHGDWLNDIKGYVKNHRPDFVMHTGDICYHSGMDWHAKNMTAATVGVPVYYCVGNHDLVAGDYGEQFFEENFGPAWYAFEKGNALFVVTPIMFGDYKPGYTREDIGGWLKNLLASYPEALPKYFFNHALMTNKDEFVFKINENDSVRLNDYNMKAWIYGHYHNNMTKTHKHTTIKSYSTATAAKGGIDHSPSSFRVINVDKQGNSTSEMIWSFVDEDLRIVSPGHHALRSTDDRSVAISVNTYHSEATADSVRYKVYPKEGAGWDVKYNAPWQQLKQASDWSWNGKYIPESEEEMVLWVEAFFNDGKVLNSVRHFHITGDLEGFHMPTRWDNLAGNAPHDGVVKQKKHQGDYHLAWSANVNSNIYMSSPVIHEDRIFVGSFDDGNASENFIHCLDAETGKEIWRYRTRNGIKNQMVIADGMVIGTDMQGYTYALDVESGKEVWTLDLSYDRMPGFVSGVVTEGSTVYTGFAESLSAVDVKTGKILWKNKAWGGGQGTTTTHTLTDSLLIAGSNWGALYAHDRFTGEVIWSNNENGLRFRDGNVLAKDGSLWVAHNGEEGGLISELDPQTGKVRSTVLTGMEQKGTNTPLVTEDRLFMASANPGVAAFDRATGDKIWQFEVGESIFHTPQYYSNRQRTIESTPILVDNKLIFGAMDGVVYVLDADSGKRLWQYEVGNPVLTSAAITDNGFIIADFAGNVYYFISENE